MTCRDPRLDGDTAEQRPARLVRAPQTPPEPARRVNHVPRQTPGAGVFGSLPAPDRGDIGIVRTGRARAQARPRAPLARMKPAPGASDVQRAGRPPCRPAPSSPVATFRARVTLHVCIRWTMTETGSPSFLPAGALLDHASCRGQWPGMPERTPEAMRNLRPHGGDIVRRDAAERDGARLCRGQGIPRRRQVPARALEGGCLPPAPFGSPPEDI